MMPHDRGSSHNSRNRIVAAAAGVMLLALIASFVLVVKGYVGGPSAASADEQARKHGIDWDRSRSRSPVSAGGVGGTGRPVQEPSVNAALQSAAMLQRDRRFEEAVRLLRPIAASHPFDREVRLSLAQGFIGLEKWKEAHEQYLAALAIVGDRQAPPTAGDEVEAKKAVTREEAALHFQAGTVASKATMIDRAEEHFLMAQTGDPTEHRYPLYLGMVQLKLGKETAAMASLLRAVKLNPDLGEAWGTLAEISLRDNHLGLASQHLERARALQPDVARWRLTEARILNRQGNPEQAATLLLALPPSERRTPGALSLLAESYGLLNKPAEAAAAYAEAAQSTPTSAEWAYQAALWYQRAGDGERSARFARAAAALGDSRAEEMMRQ